MKRLFLALVILVGLLLLFLFFIPAFGGKITISPTISFGLFSIRWYGIILALSILLGYSLAVKNSWRFGIDKKEIEDLAFWLVIVGLVGARVYYVLTNFSLFSSDLSEVYKIWHGGLSIYGAVLANLIFILFYSRRKAYLTSQLLDLLALSLPLAQALGRVGNFFNQEAFGSPTGLPWKMYVTPQFRPAQFSQFAFFHPTFLYEALWNVAVFFLLKKLLAKVKTGVLFTTYLLTYSLGRFFIEGLRVDSSFIFGVRIDQAVALILMIISVVLMMRVRK